MKIFLVFILLLTLKKLKLWNEDRLTNYYINIENILKHDTLSNIDGLDLFSKLKKFFEKKNK